MGGFFIGTTGGGINAVAIADAARQQFHRSGFGEPVRIEDPAYVLDYYPKHARAVEDLVCFGDSDFIASSGIFIFGGRAGPDALRLFWQEPDHAAALADCRGHFALIERRAGRTTLVRDPLGAYEVYHDRSLNIVTASFLALAQSLRRPTVHAAACLEYVFNGVTFGKETPVEEIQRLDIGEAIILDSTPRIVRQRVTTLCPDESSTPLSEQLAQNIAVLQEFLAGLVKAFHGRIKLSFSGGYDSRLLLALLRAQRVTPSLFVYGSESAHDVRIAREIAAAERIPLEHVDKDLFRPVTLDSFPGMVQQNFHWNDGFPQMGMFRSDAENMLRAERSGEHTLILNGGGGEVFRDFFKFGGRKISARSFVRCIFSHFDPEILATPLLHARFEEELIAKIEALLGTGDAKLDPRTIDCLYPHFRCRSWFGRANSIDNRFGDSVLPYYDRRVVESALRVPLKWKHFGNFESRMIRELDQPLARYRSGHGFPFDRTTPLNGRVPDLLLYALPPSLRRFNYRIKERFRRNPPQVRTLSRPFLASVMDPSFPVMSRLFVMPRVRSPQQFERIAVLEYLFQFLERGTRQ